MDIIAHFVWPHVDRRGPDECWPWTGNVNTSRAGHGVAYIGNERSMSAARAVYQLSIRPLERHEVIDHLCRNPLCVNPAHLEPVTQAVNVQRGRVREANLARAAAITHCPQGHEYTPDNTYWYQAKNRKAPARHCKTCAREANQRSRQRRKG
jgi:hypothetical protein